MSGSVYKRCTRCGSRVRQRSCPKCQGAQFRWAFRVRVGKNAQGRWVEQMRSGFDTRRQAERALQELQTALQRGTYIERSDLTLGGFLSQEWLPATGPPRVKHQTWTDRRRNLDTYVVPRLGGVPLQDLNAAHLNRLYAELLREGRVVGAGLSPTSVRRIHAMLRKALNDAVRWGHLRTNPATSADPPPVRAVSAARRRSMKTWTRHELRTFLDAAAGHPLEPLWRCAASTGMRRSELLGQRWQDIDFDAGTTRVRQTVLPGPDGYELIEDQKSTLSARTVHIDRRTVRMLEAHREAQKEHRRSLGDAWQDHDLVFPQADGTWRNPPAISLAFRRAVKAAGVPPIRLHDLRHTHATLLLAAGVNPKVVSERLGHSSVAFTLDTYAHVMPGMQPEAAELFMTLVFGKADDGEDPIGDAA